MTVHRISLLLIPALAACAGAPPRPFLGVPEDRASLFEDENPQTLLRGIPKVTAVRLTDEASYRLFKRSGRVVAEERRGEWLYFAIQGELHVPLPGAEDRVLAVVTERFKARVGGQSLQMPVPRP